MNVLEKIKHGLIVSCQAEGDDPFNTPEGVALFARAAQMGGAAAIRSEGIVKTREILDQVEIPVIGLVKDEFEDGSVCITRMTEAAETLCEMGCAMIAVDGTERIFRGYSGPDFIRHIRQRCGVPVMADLDRIEVAAACVAAGADCLSTTLSGYTPATRDKSMDRPDLIFLQELVKRFDIPVIAEGRINTPEQAGAMIAAGAWAVVVGTAITRPRVVTGWYRDAVRDRH